MRPRWDGSEVVVEPPDTRHGSWAGGPSAVVVDGSVHLAYRLRHPVGEGRGYVNVIARSSDGVSFEPVVEVHRDQFGGESLERPALVVTPDGRWRLYVSVATPGTKHWRVDLIDADSPEAFATTAAVTVLPGSDLAAVKDPVIYFDGTTYHLWASVHPLDDPAATDRMTIDYAVSDDGVDWSWVGTVLSGRAGEWDSRGVRPAAVVVDGDDLTMVYDGRDSAAANWEELTGIARGRRGADGRFGSLTADVDPPTASPYPPGGMRYVEVVDLPDGSRRLYYEGTREDGAHELRTELLPSA